MDNKLCIYHFNCADGFGAAWAVRQALPEMEFFGGAYNKPGPVLTEPTEIYMVDFSYKRPAIIAMAERASHITILDHHRGAEQELVSLPGNVHALFEMSKSGAILAWEYFFESEPPQLLKHIEDRDLWRFALPHTREIQANLFSYPYDFNVWDRLMYMPIEQLIADGVAIERKMKKDLTELLTQVVRRANIAGFDVPCANLPYMFASEAGYIMAHGEPFAATYMDLPEGRRFSLRSTPQGMDVNEIAKKYGGGGHRNAAGFTVDYTMARLFEEIK